MSKRTELDVRRTDVGGRRGTDVDARRSVERISSGRDGTRE
jgi:hypothetical protein